MRTPRLSIARTKPSVFSQAAACRTPSPPATISVVIAAADFNPRATISTPDDERTGPGVTARARIAGAPSAKRAAISKVEIGPAASSNWKSGNTRTPIMMRVRCWLPSQFLAFVLKRGKNAISDIKRPWQDGFRQANFSGGHDVRAVANVHAAANRSRAVPKGHPARFHRSAAGVLQPALRKGSSDLETDRTGHERFRAGADADHHLYGLPAARRHLRARRVRHRRHDQR